MVSHVRTLTVRAADDDMTLAGASRVQPESPAVARRVKVQATLSSSSPRTCEFVWFFTQRARSLTCLPIAAQVHAVMDEDPLPSVSHATGASIPNSPFLDPRFHALKSSSPPPLFSENDSLDTADVTNYESPREVNVSPRVYLRNR
jgi:hypothetical protein